LNPLQFYIPQQQKYVISEMLFPADHLQWYWRN